VHRGVIPAFGHDNYGLATSHLGMKRKREGDEDIPGVSMRGGGPEAHAAATGANAIVPTWIKRT
jgi:hypothetical protein